MSAAGNGKDKRYRQENTTCLQREMEKTKDIGKKTLHACSGIWKDIGKYKTITTVNT